MNGCPMMLITPDPAAWGYDITITGVADLAHPLPFGIQAGTVSLKCANG